jgi:hypothetical protein
MESSAQAISFQHSLTLALSLRERVGVRVTVFIVKGEARRFIVIPAQAGIQIFCCSSGKMSP